MQNKFAFDYVADQDVTQVNSHCFCFVCTFQSSERKVVKKRLFFSSFFGVSLLWKFLLKKKQETQTTRVCSGGFFFFFLRKKYSKKSENLLQIVVLMVIMELFLLMVKPDQEKHSQWWVFVLFFFRSKGHAFTQNRNAPFPKVFSFSKPQKKSLQTSNLFFFFLTFHDMKKMFFSFSFRWCRSQSRRTAWINATSLSTYFHTNWKKKNKGNKFTRKNWFYLFANLYFLGDGLFIFVSSAWLRYKRPVSAARPSVGRSDWV